MSPRRMHSPGRIALSEPDSGSSFPWKGGAPGDAAQSGTQVQTANVKMVEKMKKDDAKRCQDKQVLRS